MVETSNQNKRICKWAKWSAGCTNYENDAFPNPWSRR